MKLEHRFQMLFGLGPKFILAEQGTDPLNEPELYKRRRKRGSPWPMIITAGIALIAIVGLLAWYIPTHYR
jgi:hypothetical protein